LSATQRTIAVVFDFDDTLIPDSTSLLLKEHNINLNEFWNGNKSLVQNGYDPAHAFLKSFLGLIGRGKPLGELTNNDLKRFGRELDSKFYPGVSGLFKDLRDEVAKLRNFDIKFYIISGGLEAVIKGSAIVRENIEWTVGCRLAGDTDSGFLKHVKRCVTFTEKTRYLFEINKFGLRLDEVESDPYLVNKNIPDNQRDIPFRNMVYVGDGLTDIPCFSLVGHNSGTAFGVFNPADPMSAKRALREFLAPHRVFSMHSPKYRPTDDLGSLIRNVVTKRCNEIMLQRELAEGTDYREA
jgi:phosphoserine phosphatase